MRLFQICSFVLFTCVAGSCKPIQKMPVTHSVPIGVSADFDGGSIDTLTESPEHFLTGKTRHWKHKSSGDDQYYWFYFKLDHVPDSRVTIKLTDLIGVYRGNPHLIYTGRTQPVYSYDRINWQRIEDVAYDQKLHTLTFKNTFTRDSVWIAYAHPYPYQRESDLIHSALSESPFLKIKKLGESAQSRNINLLTITDPNISDANKKTVLVSTLQHAGEYSGGYFVEGMIDFLVSDKPEAEKLRRTTVFKILPMMNPDGIYHGMTRLNGNNEDLNQEWDDDVTDTLHAPTEPEVACVKRWIRDWISNGKKIELGLDVHSQGQEGSMNMLHTPVDMLENFTKYLNRYWPVEQMTMDFSGSANHCFYHEFQIPSGTFEIPQSNIDGGKYLTIEDYHAYGKGTAQAILDYFQSQDTPQ